MDALLSVKDLCVTFQTEKGTIPVLDHVSFEVGVGETVCIVGESGSGKSVTAKSIMRLIGYERGTIEDGSISLDGDELLKLSDNEMRAVRGKKIAMIFQEPMSAFDPVYTIGRQITESILTHEEVSEPEAYTRGKQLLEKMGISEPELRMKQYPFELSGGMLQRAMIAMALSCHPALLIADEPTTALDVTTQAQILCLLRDLQSEYHMSIILITHDLGVAATLADKIYVMYTGRLIEKAEVGQLFQGQRHPYTYGLLKSIATSKIDKNEKLYCIQGSIPNLWDLPKGCHFHPRCPHASDKCSVTAPMLEGEEGGHQAACWQSFDFGSHNSAFPAGLNKAPLQTAAVQPEHLFQIDHVSKFYQNGRGFAQNKKAPIRAVDDVSFTIERGETFGLVGESGSGKSTLGRILLQLEKATGGDIYFEGQNMSSLSKGELNRTRRDIQAIFQDPYGSMDPHWKIQQILAEPLNAHENLTVAEKKERVSELLRLVGLDENLSERYPHQFSGGQRQRIAIARAIALQSKFILADEAVSALDVSIQAQILNLLKSLQQQFNLTYLFIAHGLDVVRYLADRLGVMYLGKLVEIAPSQELFAHPGHHYTSGLIASIPKIEANARGSLSAMAGEIPSPSKPPSGCRFHPRCPAATARCSQEEPVMMEISKNHFLACHYPR